MRGKILFGLIITIIPLLSLFSITSYAGNDNLLINSGFEDGETNWYDWSDGWNTNSGAISSEYSHQEKNSACREISGQGQGGFGQIIPINPGETIKASGWIMSSGADALSEGAEAYLRIEFWNDQGPLGSGHIESAHLNKPTEWKKIEVTGEAPNGAIEARVLGFARGNNNASKGKVYFDDFEVAIISNIY